MQFIEIMHSIRRYKLQGARCKGKGLPANTLATTPHQCTAIDSCWEKLELQTDQRN